MPDAGEQEQESGAEELLGLDEAAEKLGVSRSTFKRWIAQGRIRGLKVGRQWRFRTSDVERFGSMAHPSAAEVKVDELGRVTAQLQEGVPEGEALEFDPQLQGYPASEEERAVERLFTALVADAAHAGASGLHLDAAREGTIVRRRLDGLLSEVVTLPCSVHRALIACAKLHSGLAVDEVHLPQDGRFSARRRDGKELDVRTATMPAQYGETFVMRLMTPGDYLKDLPSLGLRPDDVAVFHRALAQPQGLILAAGPVGSGITTTIYAGLQRIVGPERKTLTVEDPVEFTLPWATQIPINKRAGLTFEVATRALLRQDPDVLMVGRIDGPPVIETCAQAALAGHVVVGALAARSVLNAVSRLTRVLEPSLLAEALTCVLSARLVRMVCEHCALPDPSAPERITDLAARAREGGYALPADAPFVRGPGCDACHGTGYRGRTGLYEVMEITPEVAARIAAGATAEELRAAAVAEGMRTLAAEGLRKAAEGLTTVVEVMRVVAEEG